jgi:hypothetical protein
MWCENGAAISVSTTNIDGRHQLRDRVENAITWPLLDPNFRKNSTYLILLRPSSQLLKIFALVFGVEIDKRFDSVYPPLSQDSKIRFAHQLLS